MIRKYILFLLVVCASMLHAKQLDVKYKVTFGILGELGVSEAKLQTTGNTYTISIDAKATGIAKVLSRNRHEKHLSRGFIRRGAYYAESYTIEVTYGKKRSVKTYLIDHKKKRVTKSKKRYKEGKLDSESKETLDYYSTNDLLTLYFNLPRYLNREAKPGKYRFKAVGAEGQKGRVEVIVPKPEQLETYVDTLGKGDYTYFTAIIHQKIFDSDKGELMLSVGKDGITNKAVLKDLILFGDLVAKRVK